MSVFLLLISIACVLLLAVFAVHAIGWPGLLIFLVVGMIVASLRSRS